MLRAVKTLVKTYWRPRYFVVCWHQDWCNCLLIIEVGHNRCETLSLTLQPGSNSMQAERKQLRDTLIFSATMLHIFGFVSLYIMGRVKKIWSRIALDRQAKIMTWTDSAICVIVSYCCLIHEYRLRYFFLCQVGNIFIQLMRIYPTII